MPYNKSGRFVADGLKLATPVGTSVDLPPGRVGLPPAKILYVSGWGKSTAKHGRYAVDFEEVGEEYASPYGERKRSAG